MSRAWGPPEAQTDCRHGANCTAEGRQLPDNNGCDGGHPKEDSSQSWLADCPEDEKSTGCRVCA